MPYKTAYFHHPMPHAGYAAMISYLDDAVGKVVASVDELGLRDNTLIIFTSDNGPTFKLGGAQSDDFFHSGWPTSWPQSLGIRRGHTSSVHRELAWQNRGRQNPPIKSRRFGICCQRCAT